MVEEKRKAKRIKGIMDPGLTSGGCSPVENSPSPGGLGSGAARREDFALLPLGERKFLVQNNLGLRSVRILVKLRSS